MLLARRREHTHAQNARATRHGIGPRHTFLPTEAATRRTHARTHGPQEEVECAPTWPHPCLAHPPHTMSEWSSTNAWLTSPDGSIWHPQAQIYGRDARLIISCLVGSALVYVASYVFGAVGQNQREAPIGLLHPRPPQIARGWKGDTLESTDLLAPGDDVGLQIRAFDASTGWHLATLEADTKATIDTKLDLANSAADLWRNSTWTTRRKLLNSILEWVIAEQDTIIRVACRDTGKTAVDAFFGEILTTSSKLKYLIANAEQALRPETRPSGNILLLHKKSTVYHRPLGVCLASVSWNYPFHNILGPITAALASGNAIVVKPSEYVAFSTTYYVQCLHRILQALKLPTSLVTLVLCHPPLAPYLSKHPKINHVTFIGSEGVGRKVMADASTNLTPVTLELGGKDPAVVLRSTRIKEFQSVFMRAVFQSVGQNCIGIERFVVHESLVDELVDAVKDRVANLQCGSWLEDTTRGRLEKRQSNKSDNTIDCGAMVSSANFDKLEALIADAVSRGAKLHCGGQRLAHPRWPNGHYFQPTLISHVTPEMPIAQEELFAPVFLIMPFTSVSNAVQIANSTRMGLGSSIFGNDRREIAYAESRLHSGMVNINDFAVSYLNQSLPFGGVKASGFGRFAGPEGLRALCSTQVVIQDRFFSWIRTSIPPPVDYPLKDSWRAYEFVAGLHWLAFGADWETRARGLWGVIREAIGR